MRRDAPGRQNRRDQRDPIARARHVAVAEPGPLVARRPDKLPNCVLGNRVPRRFERHAERRELFAFDDRNAGCCRLKMTAILGGVQLAAEAGSPPRFVSERREQGGGALGDRHIHGRSKLRDGQIVP